MQQNNKHNRIELKHQITKTLNIKENGRSSDFVPPNHILGCNAGCNVYCYTRRFGRPKIYINTNIDQILEKVLDHSLTLPVKTPNQVDSKYWVYDIGCDTDINYHWKDYNWDKVLNFYTDTNNIKATFATKFVNTKLLNYGNDKLRIRFSMMPQKMSDILEKNTSSIINRLKAVDKFKNNNWDVHINLSPIVVYDNWLKNYDNLLKDIVTDYPDMLFECIFLTYNNNHHIINLSNNLAEIDSYLWKPELQEEKVSIYGGTNLRYKWDLKENYINQFKEIFMKYFNINQIRYIF